MSVGGMYDGGAKRREANAFCRGFAAGGFMVGGLLLGVLTFAVLMGWI